MKLGKKKMLFVSFMLFSLFFGAGNLIFPPFLGQSAGSSTFSAMVGFLVTAVVLPVLGIIVVAKFDGLQKLGNKVGLKFSFVFTILIYLSIGPGLGIPRAASVPFEMAIAPYMPEGASFRLFMLIYSLIFFSTACWLALAPNKLVNRLGKVLTPTLLILLVGLFISYLFRGTNNVAMPTEAYAKNPLVKGFLEGYNTMDAIAALNFGLVIATTLKTFKVTEHKDVMHYTYRAGIFAGTILALVYIMLSFMGMGSSAVYSLEENGAWTLRCIVHQLFGNTGAILLATIFTLACLTTCVGLITSISQYFSTLTKKVSYRTFVFIIVIFSFIVCNQGLNAILSISVPVLNAIYPVAIVLIVLGMLDDLFKDNKILYPLTVGAVSVESVLYALSELNMPLGFVGTALSKLPLYSIGMGWILVAVVMVLVSVIYKKVKDLATLNKKAEAKN